MRAGEVPVTLHSSMDRPWHLFHLQLAVAGDLRTVRWGTPTHADTTLFAE